jgi:ATP-dependent helicase/nuclease subunit A
MTVHGAKGLEAPIVVLPECGVSQSRNSATITDIDGQAIWLPKADERPRIVQERMSEIATAQQEESLRLLYVALTRAEQWLIVGASGKVDEKNQTDWYHRVLNATTSLGASPLKTSIGPGARYEIGDWSQQAVHLPPQTARASQPLPAYFSSPAPVPEPPPKTIAPSKLKGLKSLPGEGMEMAEALAYGTLVHVLLERLPFLSGDARQSFIAREVQTSKLDTVLTDAALREAEAVIAAPNLAPLFSRDALAEVPITASLHKERLFGTIDRLLVTPEKITAVDFKTNRIAPQDPAQTPEGLLKQMAAYSAALAQIYPDRTIETAILWTVKPILMHIPHEIVSSIAADPRYLDVDAGQT